MPTEPTEPARRLLVPLAALLAIVLGLLLAWGAATLKGNEYRAAHALAARDLDALEQAALIAAVQRGSQFAFGATSRDGRAGPLLLDRAIAQAYGLVTDPEIAGPFDRPPLRVWRLRPSEALRRRDQRFELARSLDAGIAALRARRPELAARLPPPWRDELYGAELSAALAMVTLKHDRSEVVGALESGELRRLLASAERTGDIEEDAAAARNAIYRASGDADGAEAELLEDVGGAWAMTAVYRQILPHIQARARPTAAEYLNAAKVVLIEVTGAAKWLLHLLLGGAAYAAVWLVLGWRGMPPARRVRWAFLAVVALALTVEAADAFDAVATGKAQRPAGSLADAVVTCLLPAAAVLRQRARGIGRPRVAPTRGSRSGAG